MKIKDNFVLRQIAGTWAVVAVGEACVSFNGMLSLNDSGALLWRTLQNGSDRAGLITALQAEYEVDDTRAGTDVDAFLQTLRQAGCLEEDLV